MHTDRKFRVPRIWSNRVIKELAPQFTGDVVNVSGWDDRDKESGNYRDYFINAASYTVTNYSGERGISKLENEIFLDLHQELPLELVEKYDVCFNHTTLEHIYDVRKAFSSICRMSKDIVLVVVPFCQIQHETDSYADYWRFSPSCMRRMFEENEMQVVFESASPYRNAGIYLVFVGAKDGKRWANVLPKYLPIREVGRWIGETTLVALGKILRGAFSRG